MELMSFDGEAFRLRKVIDFPDKGKSLINKSFGSLCFLWDKAIPVGVVPALPMDADEIDAENGMAPNSGRTIRSDDRIVFLSAKSLPMEAPDLPRPDMNGMVSSAESRTTKEPVKLMVCGFREEWNKPDRFLERMKGQSQCLMPGSAMHFLNTHDPAKFKNLMDKVIARDGEGNIVPVPLRDSCWMFKGRLQISHAKGDATNYERLKTMCVNGVTTEDQADGSQRSPHFDAVMIVPAEGKISAQSQDTRMMSIMCILRTICHDENLPSIHVIAENALDGSSRIALRPRCHERVVDESDFVNVQAIIARALTQGLAYPYMQPAVVQLINPAPGSPGIFICPVGMFVPLHEDIIFADVIRRVKAKNKDDITIGIRISSNSSLNTIFCPGLLDKFNFSSRDTLLIMSRQDPCAMDEPPAGVDPNSSQADVFVSRLVDDIRKNRNDVGIDQLTAALNKSVERLLDETRSGSRLSDGPSGADGSPSQTEIRAERWHEQLQDELAAGDPQQQAGLARKKKYKRRPSVSKRMPVDPLNAMGEAGEEGQEHTLSLLDARSDGRSNRSNVEDRGVDAGPWVPDITPVGKSQRRVS